MAKKKKARKARARVRIRIGNPAQGPPVFISIPGKSRKAAVANARRFIRRHTKNVEMGFYDATGFHPIRASKDYQSTKVKHGSEGKRARGKVAARTKKISRVIGR